MIVAADMVGFSRLMEIAEDETIRRQEALRTDLIDPRFDAAVESGQRALRNPDGVLRNLL